MAIAILIAEKNNFDLKIIDFLELANQHGIYILRSKNEILTDKEIDLFSSKKELFKFLLHMFKNGLLIDKRNYNYPHIKLTDFSSSSENYKEYDIVTSFYFYDKSRCFKIKE